MNKKPNYEQIWIDVKRKYHLSESTIKMAKKLGLNPKRFGSIANHKQEIWKEPLPDFIKRLYEQKFGNADTMY